MNENDVKLNAYQWTYTVILLGMAVTPCVCLGVCVCVWVTINENPFASLHKLWIKSSFEYLEKHRI